MISDCRGKSVRAGLAWGIDGISASSLPIDVTSTGTWFKLPCRIMEPEAGVDDPSWTEETRLIRGEVAVVSVIRMGSWLEEPLLFFEIDLGDIGSRKVPFGRGSRGRPGRDRQLKKRALSDSPKHIGIFSWNLERPRSTADLTTIHLFGFGRPGRYRNI